MKSLPCKPNARPLVSFTLFVSVMRNSLMLEGRHQGSVAHAENGKERTHDGSGPRNDDAADNAHLAVRIALRHAISAAPDFDDSPDKPGKKQNAESALKSGFQRGRDLRELHHWHCPRLIVQKVE